MAAKMSGGKKGKFGLGQNADINVTPFVDVLLVLLIIFMLAIPLATVSRPRPSCRPMSMCSPMAACWSAPRKSIWRP
jgi:biopolymer transport protein ExbD